MNQTAVKSLMKKYDIRAKKALGQNFLTDAFVLQKIMRSAGVSKEDAILEIGPGLGGLTQALAEKAGLVHAVEKDSRLVEILCEIFAEQSNVEIVQGDILDYPLKEYLKKYPGFCHKVCANLPYYVTTPIIMHLLENFGGDFKSITVMVQKEVAQRMAAAPKTSDYGALSLAVQYYANVSIAANVPANCFFPRPNVASAVAHLEILPQPRVAADRGIFAIIRAGFGKRRKTLVNALHSASLPDFELPKEKIAAVIDNCGFARDSLNLRAEELSLEEWATLYEGLKSYA